MCYFFCVTFSFMCYFFFYVLLFLFCATFFVLLFLFCATFSFMCYFFLFVLLFLGTHYIKSSNITMNFSVFNKLDFQTIFKSNTNLSILKQTSMNVYRVKKIKTSKPHWFFEINFFPFTSNLLCH